MRVAGLAFVSLALCSLIRVDDKNFKDVVINSGKYTLVDFYADWCRHCTNLMPAIEELLTAWESSPEVQIVKINGDADGRKMTLKYDVPGFPMLLLFHGDDKPIEYRGLRDAESISNFIQLASGIKLRSAEDQELFSSLVLLLTDYSFKTDVLRSNHKTFVLFSAAGEKSSDRLCPIWNELAEVYEQDDDFIKFGWVDMSTENTPQVKNLVALFGITHLPMILYFDPQKVDTDGLQRPEYYSGELSWKSFSKFINNMSGLERAADGSLTKDAGRIHVVEQLFRKKGKDLVSIIPELEAQLEQVGHDTLVKGEVLLVSDDVSMLAYYKRVIAQYAEDGKESLERESQRLNKILTNSWANIDVKARDYMQKRHNVLEALLGY